MGTNYCVSCMEDFTEEKPCCCDTGTNEDGTHDDGFCVACCKGWHGYSIRFHFYKVQGFERRRVNG